MFSIVQNQDEWDQLVNESAYNHPLQLWGWGELKKINGWRPLRLKGFDGFGAQILLKKIPKLNLYLAYCPRGPICPPDVLAKNIPELKKYLKQQKVISLRIEPSYLAEEAKVLGLKTTKNKILTNKTLIINLEQNLEDIKARCSSKTRQYINKSSKNTIIKNSKNIDFERAVDDIYSIYKQTAARAKFKLQKKDYYQQQLKVMAENLDVLISYSETGEPLAFLWNAFSKTTTFELYGGVTTVGQQLKANYALKFKAMESAKSRGSKLYDFNGQLNEGVSRFKEGFSPEKIEFSKTLNINISFLGGLFGWLESAIRRLRRW
jgi:peptidoglycan pentaglycine glycine transferase (the first glycine)